MFTGNIYLFVFCILLKAQDPLGKDISGDEQTGIVNQFLNAPIVVRVIDDKESAISNAKVIFSVLKEPHMNSISKRFAILQPETTYTDKDGYAKTFLKLGGSAGDYYILARHKNDSVIFHFVAKEESWLFMMFISIIGGMALFIFALNYGSKGLVRGFGTRTRDLLFNLTGNRITAVLSGFIATLIFGSCTATVSLLTRFASAGIVQLFPALAVILGANIGSTITVQLLAFNILNYALLIMAIGVFLWLSFPGLRNLAQFVFGVGLMFFSLKIISTGIDDVKYMPDFTTITMYLKNNYLFSLLTGMVAAFIFRSATAVIGLVLVLTLESAISFLPALNLVLGANLGATIFPIIISDSVTARRISIGNFIFKMVGLLLFVIIFNLIKFLPEMGGPREVAIFHTLFNVVIAVIFLPFLYPYSQFLKFLVRETRQEILKIRRLDPVFLDTPALGLSQATKEIIDMGYKTVKMLEDAMVVIEKKDTVMRKNIIQADDEIDQAEELITPYLSRLNPEEMDQKLKNMQICLLTITAELEHIGDVISKNLMNYAKKQIDSGMEFSQEGLLQIKEFHRFVLETLRMAVSSLTTQDMKLAAEVLKRRETGLRMAKEFEIRHMERLHRGLKESLETSTIHLDILSDLERINFHATEIGNAVLNLK
ncbi:MAG: Na/Pi cotransporter family protein [candidate division WOR-3 bacterium]|nr:Na/Pi cotransporter family protein [candidate division WOR-3 bacterium]